MTDPSPALEFREVSVSYESTRVLDDLDLTVAPGETMALLGPSGSGKTTLLGAVAGFIPLDGGAIAIDGAAIGNGLPPERRSVSMVFQNYALWPHLTAVEIVAYPLRRSGEAEDAAHREASRLLDRVGIGDLAARYPSQLSGGQQQRVGLARALAKQPSVYLFDEPTAHLDAALRTLLQEELIDRQRESGAAALYATHDPHEALAVADRVALLRDGRVVQCATPRRVYEEPIDAWAAQLTGPAAVLTVELMERHADVLTMRVGDVDIAVSGGGASVTGEVSVVARPEWATLGGRLRGVVHRVRYTGARSRVLLDTSVGRVWVETTPDTRLVPGDQVEWSLDHVWLVES